MIPVSPHLAARRTGREILLDNIKMPDAGASMPVIVEGAGGVLAPINEREFMTDLMCHLALPVVLAARSTLGTINHTVLSLRCLQNAHPQVRGVVLIGPKNPENHEAIEHYGGTKVIGYLPMLPEINRDVLRDVFARYFVEEAFS